MLIEFSGMLTEAFLFFSHVSRLKLSPQVFSGRPQLASAVSDELGEDASEGDGRQRETE